MRRLLKKLFERFFPGRRPGGSAARARERLKAVVLRDRTELDPPALEALRTELAGVAARYARIDPEAARIEVARGAGGASLVAVFPLKR
jgi:cell division topological specificity factor MinE